MIMIRNTIGDTTLCPLRIDYTEYSIPIAGSMPAIYHHIRANEIMLNLRHNDGTYERYE